MLNDGGGFYRHLRINGSYFVSQLCKHIFLTIHIIDTGNLTFGHSACRPVWIVIQFEENFALIHSRTLAIMISPFEVRIMSWAFVETENNNRTTQIGINLIIRTINYCD